MATVLAGLAFAALVLAQVAAVVALHREQTNRRPQAFDAALRDPRARLIQHSGG